MLQPIVKGVINAYKENEHLTKNYTGLQSRIIESLIVINVAQQLLSWDGDNKFVFELEYSVKDFFNGAFPIMSYIKGDTPITGKPIFRRDHNPDDNKDEQQQMDIAVLKNPSGSSSAAFAFPRLVSKYGIEVKSINQAKSRILKDLNRLSSAMSEFDAVGENEIEMSYSVFLRRLDNVEAISTEEYIEKRRKKETKKWFNELKKLGISYPTLTFSLTEVDCANQPENEFVQSEDPESCTYEEVAEETGVVVGYVVEISRTPTT